MKPSEWEKKYVINLVRRERSHVDNNEFDKLFAELDKFLRFYELDCYVRWIDFHPGTVDITSRAIRCYFVDVNKNIYDLFVEEDDTLLEPELVVLDRTNYKYLAIKDIMKIESCSKVILGKYVDKYMDIRI